MFKEVEGVELGEEYLVNPRSLMMSLEVEGKIGKHIKK